MISLKAACTAVVSVAVNYDKPSKLTFFILKVIRMLYFVSHFPSHGTGVNCGSVHTCDSPFPFQASDWPARPHSYRHRLDSPGRLHMRLRVDEIIFKYRRYTLIKHSGRCGQVVGLQRKTGGTPVDKNTVVKVGRQVERNQESQLCWE